MKMWGRYSGNEGHVEWAYGDTVGRAFGEIMKIQREGCLGKQRKYKKEGHLGK